MTLSTEQSFLEKNVIYLLIIKHTYIVCILLNWFKMILIMKNNFILIIMQSLKINNNQVLK